MLTCYIVIAYINPSQTILEGFPQPVNKYRNEQTSAKIHVLNLLTQQRTRFIWTSDVPISQISISLSGQTGPYGLYYLYLAWRALPTPPLCWLGAWGAIQYHGEFSNDGLINSTNFIILKSAYGSMKTSIDKMDKIWTSTDRRII